jgi:3-hydroxypropanoate dehydrogenase
LTGKLSDTCLDQLFREARTHNAWRDEDVSDALLHKLVDLVKLGPTSANCSPARFVFVKSREAKERLKPHLLRRQPREDYEGAGLRHHRL